MPDIKASLALVPRGQLDRCAIDPTSEPTESLAAVAVTGACGIRDLSRTGKPGVTMLMPNILPGFPVTA
jgi:hypothetical protein